MLNEGIAGLTNGPAVGACEVACHTRKVRGRGLSAWPSPPIGLMVLHESVVSRSRSPPMPGGVAFVHRIGGAHPIG